MNLHGIAAGAIGAVNPFVLGTVKVNTGNTTTDAGKREPTYNTLPGLRMQVQPLSQKDLAQLDGLNLQGTLRAIYISGHVEGLVRATNKGSDLIELPGGQTWLVNQVLEDWPDWCKVAVTLQNGG